MTRVMMMMFALTSLVSSARATADKAAGGGTAATDKVAPVPAKGDGTAEPAKAEAPADKAAEVKAEQKSAADIATAPIENAPKLPSEKEPRQEEPFRGIVNLYSLDYGPNAKDPAHKNWPPPFLFALFNFIVFFGLLYKFGSKPIANMLTGRHENIAKDLDEATRLHQEAEATLKQYQDKLSHLDSDIAALLAQIERDGEMERARLMQMAKDQAEWLKAEAQRQINTEIEAAREGLRVAVIDAAIAAAEKNIKEQVNEHDQRGLAERFVREVEDGKRSRS